VAIGGLDPSGEAGILADCRVFQRYKIPYRAVATAVTAQSSKKFFGSETVSPAFFRKELQSITGGIFGVKLGMLATESHIPPLITWLKKIRPRFFLWDPVLRSSTGGKLLTRNHRGIFLNKLRKMAHILTPNIPEAEALLGFKIKNWEAMETAVQKLYREGRAPRRAILLKGGHLSKRVSKNLAVDLFFDGKTLKYLKAPRQGSRARGTGCTLGSSLLANLYLGKDPLQASRSAKRFVLSSAFGAPML